MDSLADMCSFGLAAPVVVYASLAHSVPTPAAAVACIMVAGCAAVRLARFQRVAQGREVLLRGAYDYGAAVLALAVLIELPIPGSGGVGRGCGAGVCYGVQLPLCEVGSDCEDAAWLWLLPGVGALIDARLTFVILVAAYLVSGPFMWLRIRRA
jgi:CDP-diacylglycerol--serine O-phosphatidyltransferase